jgi:hypothetical protein
MFLLTLIFTRFLLSVKTIYISSNVKPCKYYEVLLRFAICAAAMLAVRSFTLELVVN